MDYPNLKSPSFLSFDPHSSQRVHPYISENQHLGYQLSRQAAEYIYDLFSKSQTVGTSFIADALRLSKEPPFQDWYDQMSCLPTDQYTWSPPSNAVAGFLSKNSDPLCGLDFFTQGTEAFLHKDSVSYPSFLSFLITMAGMGKGTKIPAESSSAALGAHTALNIQTNLTTLNATDAFFYYLTYAGCSFDSTSTPQTHVAQIEPSVVASFLQFPFDDAPLWAHHLDLFSQSSVLKEIGPWIEATSANQLPSVLDTPMDHLTRVLGTSQAQTLERFGDLSPLLAVSFSSAMVRPKNAPVAWCLPLLHWLHDDKNLEFFYDCSRVVGLTLLKRQHVDSYDYGGTVGKTATLNRWANEFVANSNTRHLADLTVSAWMEMDFYLYTHKEEFAKLYPNSHLTLAQSLMVLYFGHIHDLTNRTPIPELLFERFLAHYDAKSTALMVDKLAYLQATLPPGPSEYRSWMSQILKPQILLLILDQPALLAQWRVPVLELMKTDAKSHFIGMQAGFIEPLSFMQKNFTPAEMSQIELLALKHTVSQSPVDARQDTQKLSSTDSGAALGPGSKRRI